MIPQRQRSRCANVKKSDAYKTEKRIFIRNGRYQCSDVSGTKVSRPRGPTRDCIPKSATDCMFVGNPVSVGTTSTSALITIDKAKQTPTFLSRNALHPIVNIVSVPRIFYNNLPGEDTNSFPETCDLCCWWDKHQFTTKPVGCPVKIDTYRNMYWLEGIFCSWNCCRAYMRTLPGHLIQKAEMMLYSLMKALRPLDLGDVTQKLDYHSLEAAPHWALLKCFGGTMDIDEFRNFNCRSRRMVSFPSRMSIMPLGFDCYEEDCEAGVPSSAITRVRTACNNWNRPICHVSTKHEKREPRVWFGSTTFDVVATKRKIRNDMKEFNLTRRKPLKVNPLFDLMNMTITNNNTTSTSNVDDTKENHSSSSVDVLSLITHGRKPSVRKTTNVNVDDNNMSPLQLSAPALLSSSSSTTIGEYVKATESSPADIPKGTRGRGRGRGRGSRGARGSSTRGKRAPSLIPKRPTKRRKCDTIIET